MSAYALELNNVRKNFGRSEVICGANLQVVRGERCALIGPNGAGKSTLLNLISGRCAPSAGEIVLNGNQIAGRKPYQVNRLGLSRSFQITNIFHQLSVYDNLRCAALWSLGYCYSFWHRLGGLKDVQQRSETVLEQIGLRACRDAVAGTLTYAQQRALEIGITIVGGAGVILLDEPTAGMSRAETEVAIELIRTVTAGKTLLMVEHDMQVVFGLADRIAVLVHGEVVACDSPAKVRADPRVQEAYLGSYESVTEPAGGAI